MKWCKPLIIIVTILIAGMYGWHLFALAINKHADQAATVLIQDTLATNSAFNVKQLQKIKSLIDSGNKNEASEKVQVLLEINISYLEGCVTKKCNEHKETLNY
jgi:hypothetical protein